LESNWRLHEALIEATQKDRLIGHIARDSTAIEARERYPENPPEKPRRKRYKMGPKPKRSASSACAGPAKSWRI